MKFAAKHYDISHHTLDVLLHYPRKSEVQICWFDFWLSRSCQECYKCTVIFVVFSAVRHLHGKNESVCLCSKTEHHGSVAVHASCAVHATSRLSGVTPVVKPCNAVFSTLTVSDSAAISSHPLLPSSLASNEALSAHLTPQSSVSSICHTEARTFSESLAPVSVPSCDTASDLHNFEGYAACSSALSSSTVSLPPADARTKPLLHKPSTVAGLSSTLVSCTKESSVGADVHLDAVDGVSSLSLSSVISSSVIGLRSQESVSRQLAETNRTLAEADKSICFDVHSSCSVVTAPRCVTATSAVCCFLPNVPLATTDTSQNGLSTVGHIVSCFKSMTAEGKSEKTDHRKG